MRCFCKIKADEDPPERPKNRSGGRQILKKMREKLKKWRKQPKQALQDPSPPSLPSYGCRFETTLDLNQPFPFSNLMKGVVSSNSKPTDPKKTIIFTTSSKNFLQVEDVSHGFSHEGRQIGREEREGLPLRIKGSASGEMDSLIIREGQGLALREKKVDYVRMKEETDSLVEKGKAIVQHDLDSDSEPEPREVWFDLHEKAIVAYKPNRAGTTELKSNGEANPHGKAIVIYGQQIELYNEVTEKEGTHGEEEVKKPYKAAIEFTDRAAELAALMEMEKGNSDSDSDPTEVDCSLPSPSEPATEESCTEEKEISREANEMQSKAVEELIIFSTTSKNFLRIGELLQCFSEEGRQEKGKAIIQHESDSDSSDSDSDTIEPDCSLPSPSEPLEEIYTEKFSPEANETQSEAMEETCADEISREAKETQSEAREVITGRADPPKAGGDEANLHGGAIVVYDRYRLPWIIAAKQAEPLVLRKPVSPLVMLPLPNQISIKIRDRFIDIFVDAVHFLRADHMMCNVRGGRTEWGIRLNMALPFFTLLQLENLDDTKRQGVGVSGNMVGLARRAEQAFLLEEQARNETAAVMQPVRVPLSRLPESLSLHFTDFSSIRKKSRQKRSRVLAMTTPRFHPSRQLAIMSPPPPFNLLQV